jgi:ferredoxin--NADP+ reductase
MGTAVQILCRHNGQMRAAVTLMTPDQITDLRKQKYNATVVSLVKLHPDLLVMRVRPDHPRAAHKPGQYVLLGLGFWEPRMPGCQEELLEPADEAKVARRSYSISHPVLDGQRALLAEQNEWLEFYITLVRQSSKVVAPALTPRLFMIRQGERIFLGEKIAGAYTLDPVQPDDTVIFLGTGTGEAPHNYMLWDLLRRGHRGRILSASCVRYRRDLAYLEMHKQLMETFPQYTYIPLTTREAEVQDKGKVYVQDLILNGELERQLGGPLDPERTHVFLCGNPAMIGVPDKDRDTGAKVYPQPTGVIEILEQRGFKADQANIKFKGNIHFEEYW